MHQSERADVREYYHRHLPHQVPAGYPIFLTWNLKGSLPKRILAQLESERERREDEPRRKGESNRDRKVRHSKILFDQRDRYLDTTSQGPMYLENPIAAGIVVQSLVWGVPDRYELFAFVVMGNHVHVLLQPAVSLKVITQGIKGHTAHKINRVTSRRGRAFWQDESYDHWARDEEEMHRIIQYIEANPVRADLCQHQHS